MNLFAAAVAALMIVAQAIAVVALSIVVVKLIEGIVVGSKAVAGCKFVVAIADVE